MSLCLVYVQPNLKSHFSHQNFLDPPLVYRARYCSLQYWVWSHVSNYASVFLRALHVLWHCAYILNLALSMASKKRKITKNKIWFFKLFSYSLRLHVVAMVLNFLKNRYGPSLQKVTTFVLGCFFSSCKSVQKILSRMCPPYPPKLLSVCCSTNETNHENALFDL